MLNLMPPSVGLNRQTCQLCNLENREDVKTKAGFPERFVSCIQVTFKVFQKKEIRNTTRTIFKLMLLFLLLILRRVQKISRIIN